MINYIYFIFICFLSLPCYPQSKINIIFRIDDFGIDNELFYPKLFDVFEKHRVILNIGVVPFKYSDKGIKGLSEQQINILQNGLERNVIEIAQHGYTHESFSDDGFKSEFQVNSFDTQFSKLLKGKEYLEKVFDLTINTFIPPYNLYNEHTVRALDSLGFKYLSGALYNIPELSNTNLLFLPYTTFLDDLYSVVDGIKKNKVNNEVLIVVMMHDYEFIENKDLLLNRSISYKVTSELSLSYLDSLLFNISSKDLIYITSFNNIEMNPDLLNTDKMNKNRQAYLLKLPSFLTFTQPGYFPADDNRIIKYWIYPVFLHIGYLLIGILFAYALNNTLLIKQFTRSRLITPVIILLGMIALLSFYISSFFMFIGPLKIMAIHFITGFLLMLLFNNYIIIHKIKSPIY
jgi:peptidoglycan/xylan/chitin deacetylase (PgdA/CDA1 family)